jgi:hypothetical protein
MIDHPLVSLSLASLVSSIGGSKNLKGLTKSFQSHLTMTCTLHAQMLVRIYAHQRSEIL